MDSSCQNCVILKNQCLELKDEIAHLSKKLNKLLELVCKEGREMACQTEVIIPHNHVECQTNVISYKVAECQTDEEYSVSVNPSNPTSKSNFSQTELHHSLVDNVDVPLQQRNVVNVSHTSLPDQPFSKFDINKLEKEIIYNQNLKNRSTCYYGDYSYSYGSVTHVACTLPQPGSYLYDILNHVHHILPNFIYNSVLVTKYCDGSNFLNYHSDNEIEIAPDSNILTISLGATRICKFRKLPVSSSNPEHSLFVRHGDAVLMSRQSQDLFQHSIIADDCQSPRVSITLRLIKPSMADNRSNPVMIDATPEPDVPCTIYIGDSMFRHLDFKKLSSSSQNAIVFNYPGATAGGILDRLQNDPKFRKIDSTKVDKIILFGGTNNVDKIQNIPSHLKSSYVHGFDHMTENVLNQAKDEIFQLINYLHCWCNTAKISILNILPRVSLSRNIAINTLNSFINNLSLQNSHLTLISTEHHRSLFSYDNGNRKNQYFTQNGTDNVHLNMGGLVRLAKYLKHFVHHS